MGNCEWQFPIPFPIPHFPFQIPYSYPSPVRLAQQLPATGERLFRGRSFLPLILLPVFALTYVTERPFQPRPGWWVAICMAVSLAGLLGRVYVKGTAPSGTSERSTTSIRAARLNTRGAYSLVRHPLYTANTLIALGLTMMSPEWLFPVVALLLHLLYFERIAMAEEQFLARTFGPEFEEWSARVPALVPRGVRTFVPAPFSWNRAVGEVHALMAIGAGFFVAIVLQDSIAHGRLTVSTPAMAALAIPAVPFLIYTATKRLRR
jgi:protein-S-isoprenylcysteine O-methyltransferase Ste14